MSALDLVQMNKQMGDDPLYVYNDNGDRIDLSEQPFIDVPNTLDLVGSDKLIRKGKPYGRYMYNGVVVPRVTSIVQYCNGDTSYLLKWAANLGDKYQEQNSRTLFIGTKIHEAIAEYLTSGTLYCIKNVREGKAEIYRSLKNFIAWYNRVTIDLGWKVELFISEVPLICPWCGGTADAILIINDRKYVVDFKSSKRLSNEYFIQVSAYKWMIDNFYPEYGPIDGVGLLRFDKFSDSYEDIFLEMCVQEDAQFILHCQQTFGTALNMFYSMEIIRRESYERKKDKKQNSGRISKDLKKDPIKTKRGTKH